MKTEFICVQPKTTEAKIHFEVMMDKLHSCRVQERKNDHVLLKSISGRYYFWMNEEKDKDWEIIK